MSARQPPEQLVVGRIARPHGVRGALVVDPVSRVIESLRPGSIVFIGELEMPFEIVNIRPHRKRYLVAVEGIDDRNQADEYRDLEVKLSYAEGAPLDEHEYYYWQILGMTVDTEQGEQLGEVINIIETGANDVYIIRSSSGDDLLIPAIEDVILKVDLEANRMLVRLLPGLQTD
ncbi:MAG: ribosome maturation factor RimM [Anaerolineales bacterium]|nr:ribosome maturation factor RimM [Anaerolineales bacterium]